MSNIRAVILGTGFMSWVHAEALRRIGTEVIGILGSTPAKSKSAAMQLRIPKAYSSLEEVLNDASVDCIHICTPNKSHFEFASKSLRAGKHVLCEKPLAMSPTESSELVRIAAEHPHLHAGVNYNVRYYPLCAEVRSRLLERLFGDLIHVNGSYVQDWLLKPDDYNWRVLAEEGGDLRSVADIGTHWLDLILWMTGLEVESVCADLLTVHSVRNRPSGEVMTFAGKQTRAGSAQTAAVDISTDDYGSVLLRFSNEVRGTMHVSQVAAGRRNCLRFEIAGKASSCAWNSESPNELWIGHRDIANESLIRDPALLSASASIHAAYPGGHNEGYADSFRASFAEFYRHLLRTDDSLRTYPTFADGHREIMLCEAILKSHRTRSWIAPESV